MGRYDPRLPEAERWSLISVDAREPTASESEHYLKQRYKEQGEGVKIEKFLTRLAFAPVHDGGPVLRLSVVAAIKGKAFLVVKFDETEKVTYSNFEHVLD